MEDDKVLLRRYQDDLNVGGYGVILLGAWTVLKIILEILVEFRGDGGLDLPEFNQDEKIIVVVVIALIAAGFLLISLLIFRIHLYIGLNASRAAKGQPYKKGYYTGAVILFVLSVLGISLYGNDIQDLDTIDTTIASIIVDLTTIYVLGTVIVSTNRIKALQSKQTQEQTDHAG
ncbi:MAG: hypothetical protein K6G83_02240 [Lachnospiraceae bacterium]|nr:hypothetical protein [Lachnospiraceae bacterium]